MRALFAAMTTVLTAVALSGCGGDSPTPSSPTPVPPSPTPTPSPTLPPSPIPSQCEDSSARDISNTAYSMASGEVLTGVFSQLMQQYPNVVMGDGPFTVFAPTDAAFTAFAQDFGDVTDLETLLKYHVHSGCDLSSTFDNTGQHVSTLFSGHDLTVVNLDGMIVAGDNVTLDNNVGTVIAPDNKCSNGVVHIINRVLIPNNWPSLLTPALTPVQTPVRTPMQPDVQAVSV